MNMHDIILRGPAHDVCLFLELRFIHLEKTCLKLLIV